MAKPNFFKSAFMYTFCDMLTLFVSSFVIIPVLTKSLSQIDYSTYSICINASSLFSFLFVFGISSAVGLLYSENKDNPQNLITNAYLVQLLISLFFVLILFLLRKKVWGLLAPTLEINRLFYYAILIGFLSFSQNCLGIIFRYEQKAISFSILQIITVVLNLSFIGLYLFKNDKTVENALRIVLCTNFFTSIISYVYIFIKYFDIHLFNIDIIRSLLKSCIPFLISFILYFFSNKIFLIMIQKYALTIDVGIFNLSFQYANLLIIVSNTVMKVVSPIIYQQKKDNEWKNRIDFFAKFLPFLYISILLLLLFFSHFFISVFANESYFNKSVICLLLLGSYFNNVAAIDNQIVLSYKHFSYSNICSFLSALLTVILSILFIKNYGVIGAGLAYCISQFVNFISNYIFAWRSKGSKLPIALPCLLSLPLIIVFINKSYILCGLFLGFLAYTIYLLKRSLYILK